MIATKIKLSEKQKEVIRLMRQGWVLNHGFLGTFLIKNGEQKSFTVKTLYILINKHKLIVNDQFHGYKLTSIGNSIQL